MKVKLSIIIGVAFSVITGCRKVNDAQPQGTLLLSQVTNLNTGQVITFKYDDQNHLIEYYDGSTANDYTYVYDNNDHIIQATDTYSTGYQQDIFTYTTGIINITTSIKNNSSSTIKTTTSSYILNDKLQPIQYNLDKSAKNYILYTYNGTGNLITETAYLNGGAAPVNEIAFTYDQSESCFANVKGDIFLIFITKPNFTEKVATDFFHAANLPVHVKNTYDYNSQGFPIKQTQVENSTTTTATTTTVYVYTYITK